MRANGVYIDGQWRDGAGEQREVVNPATEEVLLTLRDGVVSDVDDAVRAATKALPAWRRLPRQERAQWLRRIADAVAERRDEFLDTVIDDVGTPRRVAGPGQVDSAIAAFRATADAIEAWPESERVGTSLVTWDALGVAALITPWNYPLYQAALKIAPALAAGCTVVMKPSEVAPLTLLMFTELLDGLGLPPGVFNMVIGPGESVGEALARHPDVAIVSFTGSGRAGRRVAEVAGSSLTPVSLELGGKGASVVLPGGDVEAAVAHAVGQCFGNAGQTCAAMTRLIVVEDLVPAAEAAAKAAVDALRIGDPRDPETTLGPVVSRRQYEQVTSYIDSGVSEGARVLAGGEAVTTPAQGYFVPPVVFTDVRPDMTIAQEEIFGPVLAIIPVADEAEAIAVAEDTRYGLTGAVWASSTEEALRVAGSLTVGSVTVNGGPIDWSAPFGGRKESGFGRERGRYGLEEFLTTKTLHVG